MGTTYRFIEEPKETSEVLEWFRSLPQPPVETVKPRGVLLYFRDLGPLVLKSDGAADAKKCPLVSLFTPQMKRGRLWTVGEVHFLATPLHAVFPSLHKISSNFSKWLSSRECIFAPTNASNRYNYYLEGSIRNHDAPIFAFESGLKAIREGRYFVGDGDNDAVLEKNIPDVKIERSSV